MLKKLVEFLDREVEVWTEENTEPWVGILKEVNPDYIVLDIDQLETFVNAHKIVAFRLSEGEQGVVHGDEGEEEEEER
ncbi:MAG: DUF2642 domain-containing protein [Planctomycetes bacterium]|nr:DUF2642 domain-containing protein [Planctomycetota bacterium]